MSVSTHTQTRVPYGPSVSKESLSQIPFYNIFKFNKLPVSSKWCSLHVHDRVHYCIHDCVRAASTAVYTAVNKCTLPCTRSCTRITAVQPVHGRAHGRVHDRLYTKQELYTSRQQFRLSPEREITQRYSYISDPDILT